MEDNNKRHLTIVEKILYASKFKILSSARTLECRHKLALLLLVFFNLSYTMFSQITDTTKVVRNFGATITATNNGISLIPTFSLGKPTVMFDLSMGKKITFEPQFRFSAEGRPWSFFFWGRYKLVNTSRFFV